MPQSNSRRIVIIGGVAAGTKTAAKARREDPDAEITIYTDEEYISYAGCGEPYYISGEVSSRQKLLQRTPQDFLKEHNILIHPQHRVTRIHAEEKNIEVLNLKDRSTLEAEFDVLVIATGASPIVPKLPGADLPGVFQLRTIPDTDAIRAKVDSGIKKAVVVGGGYIGLEMAESLVLRGIDVTVVEREKQLAPLYDEDVGVEIKKTLVKHSVRVLLNSSLEEIIGTQESGIFAVRVAGEVIETEMVLLSVGVRPNVELAREAGIAIGPTGAIQVNEYLQTNYPYIFAAGDCSEMIQRVTGKPTWVPLGSTANRQGRVLGVNVTGGQEIFPGIVGSSIFRVFDLNVSGTGLTEKACQKEGIGYECVVVPQTDKPGYMPGAKSVVVKLIAEKDSRRVLGAQVWGPGQVDKVTDTIATALVFKATVNDLTQLDLVYAPPFAPALGNTIVAANVLQGKMDRETESVQSRDVQKKCENEEDFVFLDVRNPQELTAICLDSTVNIPIPELNERADELPKEKEIIASCGIGLRASRAYRILKHKGFENVKYMEGGIRTWPEPKKGPAAK